MVRKLMLRLDTAKFKTHQGLLRIVLVQKLKRCVIAGCVKYINSCVSALAVRIIKATYWFWEAL